MLKLFYHPLYTNGIDPTARFPRDRYALLASRLAKAPSIELIEPRQITRDELITAHDAQYVDRFLNGELSDKEIRQIGLRPWTRRIVERTLHLMGGSLQALEQVLQRGGIAGNMAGGTHHAYYDFGSGYCIFNDIAVCALRALQTPSVKRVLILDLDVHQGDGTTSILAAVPGAITCSIHGAKNFPFRKQKSDLDIELADGTSDHEYLQALEAALETFPLQEFDLLLYQAGVDALKDDRLGRLALTRDGLDQRNHRVFEAARKANIPVVIFMGGGYAEPITPTIDAFEDLYLLAREYC